MTSKKCNAHDPEKIFKNLHLLEFPTSFVGLCTTMELDLGIDVENSAYIKTSFKGELLEFYKARDISASHRAFLLSLSNSRTLSIRFKPINECISTAIKQRRNVINRFVFDLRIIKVDGTPCCNSEYHAEVGRFYICGEYEFCDITTNPEVVDFDDVTIKSKVKKSIIVKNGSSFTPARISYKKSTGYNVIPAKFFLPPNSSKRILISLCPNGPKVAKSIEFHIRNPHDDSDEKDDNFIVFSLPIKVNIKWMVSTKEPNIISLQNINEPRCDYTYMDKELSQQIQRKKIANKFLEFSKSMRVKVVDDTKIITHGTCYTDDRPAQPRLAYVVFTQKDFCEQFAPELRTLHLFSIIFSPSVLQYGKVGIGSYGQQDLTIKNDTNLHITIKFLKNDMVLYTLEKKSLLIIKLKPFTNTTIIVMALGQECGKRQYFFKYLINDKYHRNQMYCIDVGNPTLHITDINPRFGMITNENFTTFVPIRIYNFFNVPVNYEWGSFASDVPLQANPCKGTVPRRGCRICELIYVPKFTKSKLHELKFISKDKVDSQIILGANVVTKKLSIKFMEGILYFRDIALNLETVKSVTVENSSRDMALFSVVEPLYPGVTVHPMHGLIRPRMVMNFFVKVKFLCIVEFNFDLCVKINNKETISVNIVGNVVEPKMTISPKNVYLPRIPCGLITYVPVNIQNPTSATSIIEILDPHDDNIFKIYEQCGYEKKRVREIILEAGGSKTVYIKVYDHFQREFDMFMPIRINKLLGPPNEDPESSELRYYLGHYEGLFDNNLKFKVKPVNKDISFCRVSGVITLPWVTLSRDKFEIKYSLFEDNIIEFTVTNVSKYDLVVTIVISKLSPNFSLVIEEEEEVYEGMLLTKPSSNTNIVFNLNPDKTRNLIMKFHPRTQGRFVATALMYLDKTQNLSYSNLTFIGTRDVPALTPSSYRIMFPPCHVGAELSSEITLTYDALADSMAFRYSCADEPCVRVRFLTYYKETHEDCPASDKTVMTIKISVCSKIPHGRNARILFHHDGGSTCDVEVIFCFTYCPLTLHANSHVKPENNPFPFYPTKDQTQLYEYFETSIQFIERWLYKQGFRRDLFPEIPNTFYALATAPAHPANLKQKGLNTSLSILTFIKRIAGPLAKHLQKTSYPDEEEELRIVLEDYSLYHDITHLLRSRGTLIWISPKYMLSYDKFKVYCVYNPPKYNGEYFFTQRLLEDEELYYRLSKQTWMNVIIQSYKVFIVDSCFFDCVCVTTEPRDIVKVIIDWYNQHLAIANKFASWEIEAYKNINNITSDLRDGVAICAVMLTHCPFLGEHFSYICEIDKNDPEPGIIHNACLIMEAMNMLRLFFPLKSQDLIHPNFIHMLFLSIHLYNVLPMFKPKTKVEFKPPLLQCSTRVITISPTSQEMLMYNHTILKNIRGNFSVEKGPSDSGNRKLNITVKYTATFASADSAVLVIHGYNKTRIFDTYITFKLSGNICSLFPTKKYRLASTIYRPQKMDITVLSPFPNTAMFEITITETEPTVPVVFERSRTFGFYISRLKLLDKEILLCGTGKETAQRNECKIYLQMVCLSTQLANSWIWFRSEIGEFFVKVTTQSRWEYPVDTLQVPVQSWPLDPCSCGESCECYRTTILMIPHRNRFMIQGLRLALMENATATMMSVFDGLIESPTGHIVVAMLLAEGGTNITEVAHILRPENTYRVASRTLLPRKERVTFKQHTGAILALPITIPPGDPSDKATVMFTSECGMDVRTYKVIFMSKEEGSKDSKGSKTSKEVSKSKMG